MPCKRRRRVVETASESLSSEASSSNCDVADVCDSDLEPDSDPTSSSSDTEGEYDDIDGFGSGNGSDGSEEEELEGNAADAFIQFCTSLLLEHPV